MSRGDWLALGLAVVSAGAATASAVFTGIQTKRLNATLNAPIQANSHARLSEVCIGFIRAEAAFGSAITFPEVDWLTASGNYEEAIAGSNNGTAEDQPGSGTTPLSAGFAPKESFTFQQPTRSGLVASVADLRVFATDDDMRDSFQQLSVVVGRLSSQPPWTHDSFDFDVWFEQRATDEERYSELSGHFVDQCTQIVQANQQGFS